MATTATLIITLLNVVLVFVVSLIGGDGTELIWKTQYIGFTWVAVASGFALVKCSKGSGRLGVVTALLTVPVGLTITVIAAEIWSLSGETLRKHEAIPNEVTESCKVAGATFIASPSMPVHSIAFDWQTQLEWGRMSYFNSDSRKFGGFRFLEDIKYPETILFIEQKARGVTQAEKQWPYKRRLNGGEFVEASELTADILVTYEFRNLSKADARNSYVLADISVTDRRNGKALATLRYVTGGRDTWPICGETSKGEMNIAAFIFKAIGIPSN